MKFPTLATRKWLAWFGKSLCLKASRFKNAVSLEYEYVPDKIRREVWPNAHLMRPPRKLLEREKWLAIRCEDGRVILYPKALVRAIEMLPRAVSLGRPTHYA